MSPHKSTGTAWTHQRAAFSEDSLFVQTGVRWRVFFLKDSFSLGPSPSSSAENGIRCMARREKGVLLGK